jgi:arsenate reductase (glutaredoxin)
VTATIWHNPGCGTSRNVLALLRASGEEVRVVEYVKTPPSRAELADLLQRMGLAARDLLRRKEAPYAELGLGEPALADDRLIDAMMEHPILINRPIVATPRGVRLCRPSDMVLDLLATPPVAEAPKSDGSPFLRDSRIDGADAALAGALTEAALPTDDLAEPGRRFFAYRTLDGATVGFAGYELFGPLAFLRSIVVLPEARGKKNGANLLALLMRRAFDEGAREAWLLTTGAADYFKRRGFQAVPRDSAPPAILATRQAAALCPVSAAVMRRTITL